ncbi:MAG TPA: 2,3-bisphosphoglycerate-independent phosphoglycerate mutase [bacterium]|nr:MAG: 2,3-bisphosphoglycerate-independent phosphoglycerate mutase [Parcubacteria group bacterium ADurb.Bin192]HPN14566.1 2,3-bisphosphoglycerate-independent phosphoglycerate mutase [bacterium]
MSPCYKQAPKAKGKLCRGPVVLLIWDGFGYSKNKAGNAVMAAKMPNWHHLWGNHLHTLLKADGPAVGLPVGETGNSEAGHSTLGAGRPVVSDKVKINKTISKKIFEDNPAFTQAALHVLRRNSTLHLIGMLTNHQSGHADFGHILASVEFAKRLKLPKVALHLFTDGRDTAPYHASKLLLELERHLTPNMRIATIMGRFYAMDRDRNWKRTELAYNCMCLGQGVVAETPIQAIEQAYARGESDEFMLPTVITYDSQKPVTVNHHDAVIFWNLRSDRARQMVKPFIQKEFARRNKHAFTRQKFCQDMYFATMTEFGKQIDGAVPAFPHHELSCTLVEALRSKRQIYIAESEKYSQVTYFFNGGYDTPKFDEERVRIQSIRTAALEKHPRMKAPEVAKAVISAVKKKYDFVCANFANADMIGHTGDFEATVKACEALDEPLGKIWQAVKQANGCLMITADHGNAEQLFGAHGERDTQHNPNPVPFLICCASKDKKLKVGTLADVAPTILAALCVSQPDEMKGRNLLS